MFETVENVVQKGRSWFEQARLAVTRKSESVRARPKWDDPFSNLDADDLPTDSSGPSRTSRQIGLTAKTSFTPATPELNQELASIEARLPSWVLDNEAFKAALGTLKCSLEALPSVNLTGGCLSDGRSFTYSGRTRVYASFKPQKIVLESFMEVLFAAEDGIERIVVVTDHVPGVAILSAFSGAENCFPFAPGDESALAGSAFAYNAPNNAVSWPTINAGIDFTMQFVVPSTVYASVPVPTGFRRVPNAVNITTRAALFGPALR